MIGESGGGRKVGTQVQAGKGKKAMREAGRQAGGQAKPNNCRLENQSNDDTG